MTREQKAQTAIELTVFGAILIFTLGVIVRSAVGRGNQQQAVLKATRMALTMSYITSDTNRIASRNNAFVLIVEDRLTAASAKYGAIDRSPFITQGSGVHSSNLFMPVDFGDTEDIPVFDVFVNGTHFSFTTGAFKTVALPSTFGLEPECVGVMTVRPCADEDPCPADCTSCSSTSLETYTTVDSTLPCPVLYTIIDNHPASPEWCDVNCPPSCSVLPGLGCNLSAEDRFNLDHAGRIVPIDERARFAWQWYFVAGFEESDDARVPPAENLAVRGGGRVGTTTITGLLKGEGINVDASKNIDVDVDGDLKLERVLGVLSQDGIIQSVDVRDLQDGDVDFSRNDSDPGPDPGLTRDVNIFTSVRGGTYLQIDEGKLFAVGNDTRQFIRTASKKDTIDIIEREFQLSNNTGRFCSGSGARNPRVGNPVQACNNCFSVGNAGVTCMDTESLIIYIRSSVSDLRGRKWTTDVSSDPYVNLTR